MGTNYLHCLDAIFSKLIHQLFLRLLVLSIKNTNRWHLLQLVLLLCPYRKDISTWSWQLFLLAFVCPRTVDIKSFQILLPTGSSWQKSWKPLPTLVYCIRLFPSMDDALQLTLNVCACALVCVTHTYTFLYLYIKLYLKIDFLLCLNIHSSTIQPTHFVS